MALAAGAYAKPCPPGAKPDWAKLPTGEDLARTWSLVEQRITGPGSAVIQCVATETGALADCKIIAEEPPGYGYGQATLKTMRFFRIARPGCPDAGQIVRIPIRFEVAKDETAAPEKTQPH